MADFVKVSRIDGQGDLYISRFQIIAMNDFSKEDWTEIILNTKYFGNDPLLVKGCVQDILDQFEE